MDKLKLAHDYLLKIMSNSPLVDQVDIEFAVSTAWSYARMMHSEKIKEDKTDSEQKRKEIREMLNAPNTFVEREGQHFDDVEWQPDWSQAPEWANWWAMDADSDCYWFENKPEIMSVTWLPFNASEVGEAKSFGYTGNWQDSLRERPHGF